MNGFMLKGLSIVLFSVLVFSLVGAQRVNGFDQGSVKDGVFNKLRDDIEKSPLSWADKQKAKVELHDKMYGKSSSDNEGTAAVFALIIIIGIAYFIFKDHKNFKGTNKSELPPCLYPSPEETQEEEQADITSDKELIKTLRKAESLGFSIRNEYKECSSCGITIKLNENICQYCQYQFSTEEMDKDIQVRVDEFLSQKDHHKIPNIEDKEVEKTDTLKNPLKNATCGKCGFKRIEGDEECPRCGVIYAKIKFNN